jgi:polyisoprenoid-binding protein YceI
VGFQAGTYRLGPSDGTLIVRTQRTGAAAKAGHNLLIHVTSWEATLEVPADAAASRLELSADGGSLEVQEGTGGMQALGESDKASIHQTIDDEVLKGQRVSFRSTSVQQDGDGLRVEGDLTLVGATHSLAFDVRLTDGTVSAAAVIKQTAWGIKPYSTLFGALKVVDEVEVSIEARLPAAG